MSKKRFLSIILSVVMLLSLACSALAVGQSGRYIGNSTVNGSIYQTYYQVDAQTRTGMQKILENQQINIQRKVLLKALLCLKPEPRIRLRISKIVKV